MKAEDAYMLANTVINIREARIGKKYPVQTRFALGNIMIGCVDSETRQHAIEEAERLMMETEASLGVS